MARRKEFKAIADGLISSFVSRNNDVYGYWGIGKLYSHMLASKSMTLEINLIKKSIEPINKEFEILIEEYSKKLHCQIKNRRMNKNFLMDARLIINGYSNEISPQFGRLKPHRIECNLIIIDDLNKEHSSLANAWCREHNPLIESKSTREY